MRDKHIETKIKHSDLPVVTSKYGAEHKERRFVLVDEPEYQPFRRSIRNDLAEKLVKTLRKEVYKKFRI